jgi:hypothetical protein
MPFCERMQIALVTRVNQQAHFRLETLDPSLILRLATFNFRLGSNSAFPRPNVTDALSIERFNMRKRSNTVVASIQSLAKVMQVLIQC